MKNLAIILILLFVSGCAPDGNPVTENAAAFAVACADSVYAGFWLGLWHGIIAPFSWFFSLFMSDVNVYEVCNNGGWYDFGFVLGAGILGSLLSSSD
jgi:hypothetical protein